MEVYRRCTGECIGRIEARGAQGGDRWVIDGHHPNETKRGRCSVLVASLSLGVGQAAPSTLPRWTGTLGGRGGRRCGQVHATCELRASARAKAGYHA